ncbi:MAG: transporter substrate-binding domain-containing protein [Victivallales bacterium]|nr:transporter substrate-binding domain-containing protein [Victivallales bacterium]
MKKSLSLVIACILAVALFSGCGEKKEKKAGSAIDKIKAAGELVVYTNPEFAPYEYLGKDEQIVGAEIDIVHKIAAKLGVKAKVVSAEFDSIIGTVQTGKADVGASGFTITDERKKIVDFSKPFVVSVQYLIVPEACAAKGVEEFAGKRIGGQNGTTGLMMIEDAVKGGVLKDTKTEVKSFNNAPDAVVAMVNGRLDAVVIDELVAISLAKKNPGYKAIPLVDKNGKGLDAPEEFGMIVAKGKEDLLNVINEVIDEMLKDGSMNEAILKHNGLSVAQ